MRTPRGRRAFDETPPGEKQDMSNTMFVPGLLARLEEGGRSAAGGGRLAAALKQG